MAAINLLRITFLVARLVPLDWVPSPFPILADPLSVSPAFGAVSSAATNDIRTEGGRPAGGQGYGEPYSGSCSGAVQ